MHKRNQVFPKQKSRFLSVEKILQYRTTKLIFLHKYCIITLTLLVNITEGDENVS